MDTKALQQAEEAVKVAVAEYEKLVAGKTNYDDKISIAKSRALAAAANLRQLRKEMIGSDIGLGSISTRGRKPKAAGAAPGNGGTGKKRGRPAKAAE